MRRIPPRSTRLGTAAAALLLAVLFAGCLDVLPEDQTATRIAEAADAVLAAPIRASESHWFLREQPGWISAHHTTYGGTSGEPLTDIRVARFRDPASAQAAFARLTPAYAFRLWGRRMAEAPRTVRYPFSFPGDEVRTTEYRPQTSPGESEQNHIVQLIGVRSGSVVIVIESIGVPRERLPEVADALIGAAQDELNKQDD